MAFSFHVGYISLDATLVTYSINGSVTFSAGSSGAPRCTVTVEGMYGSSAFIFVPFVFIIWFYKFGVSLSLIRSLGSYPSVRGISSAFCIDVTPEYTGTPEKRAVIYPFLKTSIFQSE